MNIFKRILFITIAGLIITTHIVTLSAMDRTPAPDVTEETKSVRKIGAKVSHADKKIMRLYSKAGKIVDDYLVGGRITKLLDNDEIVVVKQSDGTLTYGKVSNKKMGRLRAPAKIEIADGEFKELNKLPDVYVLDASLVSTEPTETKEAQATEPAESVIPTETQEVKGETQETSAPETKDVTEETKLVRKIGAKVSHADKKIMRLYSKAGKIVDDYLVEGRIKKLLNNDEIVVVKQSDGTLTYGKVSNKKMGRLRAPAKIEVADGESKPWDKWPEVYVLENPDVSAAAPAENRS